VLKEGFGGAHAGLGGTLCPPPSCAEGRRGDALPIQTKIITNVGEKKNHPKKAGL